MCWGYRGVREKGKWGLAGESSPQIFCPWFIGPLLLLHQVPHWSYLLLPFSPQPHGRLPDQSLGSSRATLEPPNLMQGQWDSQGQERTHPQEGLSLGGGPENTPQLSSMPLTLVTLLLIFLLVPRLKAELASEVSLKSEDF